MWERSGSQLAGGRTAVLDGSPVEAQQPRHERPAGVAVRRGARLADRPDAPAVDHQVLRAGHEVDAADRPGARPRTRRVTRRPTAPRAGEGEPLEAAGTRVERVIATCPAPAPSWTRVVTPVRSSDDSSYQRARPGPLRPVAGDDELTTGRRHGRAADALAELPHPQDRVGVEPVGVEQPEPGRLDDPQPGVGERGAAAVAAVGRAAGRGAGRVEPLREGAGVARTAARRPRPGRACCRRRRRGGPRRTPPMRRSRGPGGRSRRAGRATTRRRRRRPRGSPAGCRGAPPAPGRGRRRRRSRSRTTRAVRGRLVPGRRGRGGAGRPSTGPDSSSPATSARLTGSESREPDADLAGGGLGRVGAVDEVLLDLQAPVATQVAADGAGRGGRSGRSCRPASGSPRCSARPRAPSRRRGPTA